MPLPPAKLEQLQIDDFQGIDIERNVLARPENSFMDLVNFDLVKPGVIRKIRGFKRLTPDSVEEPLVAFRDYQSAPGEPEYLVVVGADTGKLYVSGMSSDPIILQVVGKLLDPEAQLEEAPFVISMPFKYNGENRQSIVVTLGKQDYPKRWDGAAVAQANIFRLGIDNPGDSFTVPFQHSVAIPGLRYEDAELGKIFYYSTPDSQQGIPVLGGIQYRAAWFNPTTGHKSSLFPLHLGEYFTDVFGFTANIDKTQTKQLGFLQPTQASPFVMAVPLFLDNLPTRETITPALPPQEGYTRILFYRTQDGGKDFFKIPRLYDKNGERISFPDGSVSIEALNYGFLSIGSVGPGFGITTPIYDGFAPMMTLTAGGANPLIPEWYEVIKYNEVVNYTINGGGQAGNFVTVERDAPTRAWKRGYFYIEGDSTLYLLVAISDGGLTPTWTITPALVEVPADGARIIPAYVKPVPDVELIDSFIDSTESPFDRINDPPPKSSWGVVYQNRLFLLDAEDKTRLVYSRIGDYESFPPNNVFRFTQADFDPITALLAGRQVGLVSEGADQRLIIAKQQSTYQITGTSILDFALTGLFPETGIVQKRAAIVVGGFTVVLTRQGIEIIETQRPIFIGSRIKDFIDGVNLNEYGPCFAIDRKDNQILFGFDRLNPATPPTSQIEDILTIRPPRIGPDRDGFVSPFARIFFGPRLLAIQESGFGDNVRMLASGADGNIYQFYTGGLTTDSFGNTSPLTAIAVTQELPQAYKDKRKIFHRVRFDGNEVTSTSGWTIQFSVDGGLTYTPVVTMYSETLIGIEGKTLVIRMFHDTEVPEDEDRQLSNMMLEYSIIGEAR